MLELPEGAVSAALNDFHEARRQADRERLLAWLTGRSTQLLPFHDVSRQLKMTGLSDRGLQEIPVAAIVGSVGRAEDFTRTFLPKKDSYEGRWARVKSAMLGQKGLPPIEVYQVGDAYFVRDGNHRVSIARQMGIPTMTAFVTEVKTRVPLSPDDDPDRVISKAEYAAFLEHTDLDRLRPDADLLLTISGQYPLILEHIEVHRYFMGLDQERDEIPYPEAVAHWYDHVYKPMVAALTAAGLPEHFPRRTMADLYVLIALHRAQIEADLGFSVDTETVVADFAEQKSPSPIRVLERVGDQVLDALTPDALEGGPEAGSWRRERVAPRPDGRLFARILVAGRGAEVDWKALDHALLLAQRDGGRLIGLQVQDRRRPAAAEALTRAEAEFMQRCREAGVPADFRRDIGKPERLIVERSNWADLLVLGFAPGRESQPIRDFRSVLQRSPRPVLAVPGAASSKLKRAMVAYDGSRKAEEALFVATHVAHRWSVQLVVAIVAETPEPGPIYRRAEGYLQRHGVIAEIQQRQGEVAPTLLQVATETNCDWIIMGGFGVRPLLHLVLGSTVDQLLQGFDQPILICR